MKSRRFPARSTFNINSARLPRHLVKGKEKRNMVDRKHCWSTNENRLITDDYFCMFLPALMHTK